MADNVTLNTGAGGDTCAADDIAGIKFQRVKLVHGADGINDGDVSSANGLPVQVVAALPAGANAIGKLAANSGVDIGDVDVTSLPALVAGSAKIGAVDLDSDATIAAAVPTVAQFVAGTDGTNARALKTDAAGELQIDVLTLPALVAGTANIGDVDVLSIAAGDNNIGNVDIVTMPNVTLAAGTNTNEVVGDAAHDAVVAGNPVLNGAYAESVEDSDANTNANRVSADGDAVRLLADRYGALYTNSGGPFQFSYSNQASAAQTDTVVHAAPAAGLSIYVKSVFVACNGAVTITVEEGTAVFKWRYYGAAAGDGASVTFGGKGLKLAAATSLTYTTSGAVEHTIVVVGEIAP